MARKYFHNSLEQLRRLVWRKVGQTPSGPPAHGTDTVLMTEPETEEIDQISNCGTDTAF